MNDMLLNQALRLRSFWKKGLIDLWEMIQCLQEISSLQRAGGRMASGSKGQGVVSWFGGEEVHMVDPDPT